MPTYLQICISETCRNEFEDLYSSTAPVPPCPVCGSAARRLINSTTKGVVEYSGHELIAKHKEDTNKLKKEIYASEKLSANFLGESSFQARQQESDKYRRGR